MLFKDVPLTIRRALSLYKDYMALVPFWFSMEQCSRRTALTPFWLSADYFVYAEYCPTLTKGSK